MMRMRRQRMKRVNPKRRNPKRTAWAPRARSRILMLLHRTGGDVLHCSIVCSCKARIV